MRKVKDPTHRVRDHPFLIGANDATRLASVEITAPFAAFLSTSPSRLALPVSTGRRKRNLLPTPIAAEAERLHIALALGRDCFAHGHSADGIFGHGFRFFRGHVPFLVVVVHVSWFLFSRCFGPLSLWPFFAASAVEPATTIGTAIPSAQTGDHHYGLGHFRWRTQTHGS
jgi:hypothetical protein